MNNYLLAYYDGAAPTFFYADTIDAARSYATTIANGSKASRNHVLSIVDVATDQVVFHAKGESLSTRLSNFCRSVTNPVQASRLSLKPLLYSGPAFLYHPLSLSEWLLT